MVAALVAELQRTVSMPRLTEYRPTAGSDLEMVVNYFWNIELAEALYPGLAALEVSLRNSIHDAISTDRGTDHWYYEPGLLEPQQLREFANARFTLFRTHGNQPGIGRVVAELNFAFWVTLLSRNYHHALWNPNRAALLQAVFPHLTGPGFQRQSIHQRYNELRKLRNRVFHHEPVWNRPSLQQDHRAIHEAIGWISPGLFAVIKGSDRFDAVFQHGRGRIEAMLKAQLGIA